MRMFLLQNIAMLSHIKMSGDDMETIAESLVAESLEELPGCLEAVRNVERRLSNIIEMAREKDSKQRRMAPNRVLRRSVSDDYGIRYDRDRKKTALIQSI